MRPRSRPGTGRIDDLGASRRRLRRHRVRSVSIRVMPADSGKFAETAQDLVQWILDQALDGIGPLPSASDLADDYKSKPYANDAERVQGLIRWAVAKNAGTGF